MPDDVCATWGVFPLWPIVDGRCGCGLPKCPTSLGKHPKVRWSLVGPGQMEPGAGFPELHGAGIRTGAEFGIFVVETDQKPGIDGEANLSALGTLALPRTYTVKTPSGSIHRYFRHPGGFLLTSSGKVAPGVDVRGDGGMVVAEGSPHRSGQRYEAEDGTTPADVVAAPEWLLAAVRATFTRDAGGMTEGFVSVTPIPQEDPRWPARIAQGEKMSQRLPPAVQGLDGSGAALTAAMFLTRGLEIAEEEAFEILKEHWNPRCDPPWTDDELWHKVQDSVWTSMVPGSRVESDLSRFDKMVHPEREEMAARPEPTAALPRKGRTDFDYRMRDYTGDELTPTNFAMIQKDLHDHSSWAGVLRYDEFSGRVYAVNPPIKMLDAVKGEDTEETISAIMTWFALAHKWDAKPEAVRRALLPVAQENMYHPVREYLRALPAPGPGTRILDNLASAAFGDVAPIAQVMIRKFLVAAVRRVMEPGPDCQVDTMLLLQGEQGYFKSTFAKTLFNRGIGRSWYIGSAIENLESKETTMLMQGHWCVEFQEFDSIVAKKDAGGIKAFITTIEDNFRPPYARGTVKRARQCVLIGTSNHPELLQDPTGARRFWPIKVHHEIDILWLEAHADRIWSEAYEIAMRPHSRHPEDAPNWHWLTKEEEAELKLAQEGFTADVIGHDEIVDYCKGRATVQVNEILGELVIGAENSSARKMGLTKKSVEHVLLTMGCKIGRASRGDGRLRGYVVPLEIQFAAPSARELRRRWELSNPGQPCPAPTGNPFKGTHAPS